jgi:hypothetical protein
MSGNPSESDADDEELFVESHSRPQHATDQSADSEDVRGGEPAGNAADPRVQKSAETEAASGGRKIITDDDLPEGMSVDDIQTAADESDRPSSEPSEEFLNSLSEENAAKFKDSDTDVSSEESAVDAATNGEDKVPEEDVDEGLEALNSAAEDAEAIREEAGKSESAEDPLAEYEDQDLDSLSETPDAFEYTHRGVKFLLAPPTTASDSTESTDAREEFQKMQGAMQKLQNGEEISDHERETVDRMLQEVVQRVVRAPEISDSQWEEWPDGTQNALVTATANYLQDIVSGFTRERKDGLDPETLR